MIPKKIIYLLVVCLTFVLLSACEPLAPEQTPQYVIVTGETQPPTIPSSPTLLLNETIPAAESTLSPSLPTSTTVANAGGVVNTPVSSPTSVPPPTALPSATPFGCQERTGFVFETSFYSAVIGGEVAYRMYLPPCFYDTFRRYPYVVLLHGTNYTDSMWQDLGAVEVMDQGITKDTLPPMVLIMPDGDALAEYNDLPEGQSWETVILEELIPAVEETYCLWGDRQGRAIGGISRGGFWAFSIALRHPETFGAVGGHSPHFAPDNAAPENNPLDLAGRVILDKFPLRIYMDNGANDYVGTFAIQMSELLRASGIEHEYLINPTGDHTEDYWSLHMAEYLSFYGQPWPHDPGALPSCLDLIPES